MKYQLNCIKRKWNLINLHSSEHNTSKLLNFKVMVVFATANTVAKSYSFFLKGWLEKNNFILQGRKHMQKKLHLTNAQKWLSNYANESSPELEFCG